MRKIILTFVFYFMSITVVMAQAVDCPTVVKAALDTVDASCADTSRNQVCYGNISLKATPREGVSNLTFTKAGDRASVADIQALQLSSMSLSDESWGVALMKVQANLPDTLPGQNVTFLLFGDVQIDNNVTKTSETTLTATSNVNVRLRPSTSGNNIMSSLKAGQQIVGDGRLPDSSWVRIKVGGVTNGTGWVSADFLKGDLSKLSVIEPDARRWGLMQSFYFTTGVGDRPCAQAPDSGILVQTPKGVGKVTLNINDVQITLGSTVYLQAQPNNLMTVTVIEGQATLQAGGQTQIVPAGTYSQVQLDASGHATGSASFPKPYDALPLQTLPLKLKVFNSIVIAPPLTTAQIKTALESPLVQTTPATTAGNSTQNGDLSGRNRWNQTQTITENTCRPDVPGQAVGTVSHATISLTFNDSSLVWGGWETLNLGRVSDNIYQGTFDNGHRTVTLTFTSSTSYNFTWDGNYDAYNGIPACVYVMHGSGEFRG